MLTLLLAALLTLGGLPMTDDILDRLARLEQQATALGAQQQALVNEMVRRRGPADAMTERDVAALLSPRGLTPPIGTRGAADRTPDLATPLLSRLRDDAALSAYAAGRTDTFDGYANLLRDPNLDRLYAGPTTLSTTLAAIGPNWDAKYILNSGTVATTRTIEGYQRSRNLLSIGSSAVAVVTLSFGTSAADMDVVIESDSSSTVGLLGGVGIEPSWLVGSASVWLVSEDGLATVEANVEIVPGTGSDTVGEPEDLLTALSGPVARVTAEAAREGGSFTSEDPFTYRLRINVTKAAGATADMILVFSEPVLAYSEDGSVPAYTPALGSWHPQQLMALPFTYVDLPAGATTTLNPSSGTTLNLGSQPGYHMPWSGSIVGMSYRMTDTATAGTFNVRATVNGSNVWAPWGAISSPADDVASQYPGTDTFSTGDYIGAEIVTTAGYLPTTRDFVVTVYVLLDYEAV